MTAIEQACLGPQQASLQTAAGETWLRRQLAGLERTEA
jgi:hypothetical protein